MAADDFARIEAALQRVGRLAARLPVGDPQGHVRRSLDELSTAFVTRGAVEPVADRLLASLRMLNAAHIAGHRRDFQRDAECIERLLAIVRTDLLPALRRVGFHV